MVRNPKFAYAFDKFVYLSLKDCLAAFKSMTDDTRAELTKEFDELGILYTKWLGACWKYNVIDKLLRSVDKQCYRSGKNLIDLAVKFKKGDISQFEYDDERVKDEARNQMMIIALRVGNCTGDRSNYITAEDLITREKWKENVKIPNKPFENESLNKELKKHSEHIREEYKRRLKESLHMIDKGKEIAKEIEEGKRKVEDYE